MSPKPGLTSNDQSLVIFLTLLGSLLQALAHGAIEPALFGPILLMAGWGLFRLVLHRHTPELRAFMLTYAACVLVGGLAQCYSWSVFGKLQSTPDSRAYLDLVSQQVALKGAGKIERNLTESPMAISTWAFAFAIPKNVGLSGGVYIAVMFNALLMGVVGGLSVRIARELFGDDHWRLRRVGTLVSSYGMFLLFGSVLIRDCFTTFAATLLLLGMVIWLKRPTFSRLSFAASMTGVYVYCMMELRPEAIFMPILYWSLLILLSAFVGSKGNRATALLILLLAGLFAGPFILNYFIGLQGVASGERDVYGALAMRDNASESLGMRLVVSQPLPIRMIVGSFVQMINPIPLWSYFRFDAYDYHWIKGYSGIHIVVILPLAFAGMQTVFRMFKRDRVRALPILFVLLYFFINFLGVVASSMESRHIAQFFPALAVMAVLPDTRKETTRRVVADISKNWFLVVLAVHIMWIALKVVM